MKFPSKGYFNRALPDKSILTLVAVVIAGLTPMIAHASSSSPAEHNMLLSELKWPIVNSSITGFLLYVIYRYKLTPLLHTRTEDTKRKLQEASSLLTTAKTVYESASSRSQALTEECSKIVADYETQAHEVIGSLSFNTQHVIQQLKDDLKRQIYEEQRRAANEVRLALIAKSATAAKKYLAESLTHERDRGFRMGAIDKL